MIKGSAYKRGLDFFRDSHAWNRWALIALFALGVGHILAGIIFFFAFNWNDLSATHKFLIVQGGISVSVLIWLMTRLDSLASQAFGIAATVLVGVLLAVFGQVFQTPAAIYTPFILWAVLTLPFAVVSKSVGHWTVWMAIGLFGAMTYIGDGLSSTQGNTAARWAYYFLSLVILGLSALYHILSNSRFMWAKTSWFRLTLITVAFSILFCLFTDGFWDLWERADLIFVILGLGTAIAALGVSYTKIPTLPALSLMTFFIAFMIAQFGFKFIFDGPIRLDTFGELLLGFIWMAGLTYVLARAFRHYQNRFGKAPPQASIDEDGKDSKNLAEFTQATGVSFDAFAEALSSKEEDVAPWYVELLLGFSGVVTAVFAGFFVGSIVTLLFGGKPFIPALIIGLLTWVTSLLLRLKTGSKFGRHFFNTLMIGGGAVASVSLGFEFEGNIVFILGSLALVITTLWLVRDTFVEFIMAAAFFGLTSYTLAEFNVSKPYVWLCILFTPLAVISLVWPYKRRLFYSAGTAFLFLVPIAGMAYYYRTYIGDAEPGLNIIETAVGIIVTVGVVIGLNRLDGDQFDFKPPLMVLLPLLLAMCLMPVGSAAALVTVLVGYILGSRAITLIGVLMQIYFLFLFYYDLQISLLQKSILLLISGVIFVSIWFVCRNRIEARHA